MRMLQFHLYMLIWCQAAEALKDQLTDLGHNVTLICDLAEQEVYWLLQNFPYSPVVILRSFEKNLFYYNQSFKQKYSVNSKHLIIKNITSNDLGVYYCMSTSKDPKFCNGTRLSFIEPTPLNDCHNSTVQYIQQNQTSWLTLTIFGLLTAVLVSVIIGLLKIYACRNNRSVELSEQFHNTDQQKPITQQQPELNQLQNPLSSIYVALELPKLQTQE